MKTIHRDESSVADAELTAALNLITEQLTPLRPRIRKLKLKQQRLRREAFVEAMTCLKIATRNLSKRPGVRRFRELRCECAYIRNQVTDWAYGYDGPKIFKREYSQLLNLVTQACAVAATTVCRKGRSKATVKFNKELVLTRQSVGYTSHFITMSKWGLRQINPVKSDIEIVF